ncbi:hypothetical protein AV530_000817 [Patagioenas fasciata monilis]|uniref:Uncharacterized protein n=1 Tax=Patagioenas fasciata monilis TaxID=372326 RepID=A0A1V4KSB5_PATFA|nr:hypothetical protein AV530_000817 [Patagioenas fasciata monilis]
MQPSGHRSHQPLSRLKKPSPRLGFACLDSNKTKPCEAELCRGLLAQLPALQSHTQQPLSPLAELTLTSLDRIRAASRAQMEMLNPSVSPMGHHAWNSTRREPALTPSLRTPVQCHCREPGWTLGTTGRRQLGGMLMKQEGRHW